jgi:hypothetical protein
LENLDEILLKKLDGLTPGLREEVSWDELGMPYIPEIENRKFKVCLHEKHFLSIIANSVLFASSLI